MAHVPEVTGEAGPNPDKHPMDPMFCGPQTLKDKLDMAQSPAELAGNRNYPGPGPSTPKG